MLYLDKNVGRNAPKTNLPQTMRFAAGTTSSKNQLFTASSQKRWHCVPFAFRRLRGRSGRLFLVAGCHARLGDKRRFACFRAILAGGWHSPLLASKTRSHDRDLDLALFQSVIVYGAKYHLGIAVN